MRLILGTSRAESTNCKTWINNPVFQLYYSLNVWGMGKDTNCYNTHLHRETHTQLLHLSFNWWGIRCKLSWRHQGKSIKKSMLWKGKVFSYEERGLRGEHYINLHYCSVLQKKQGIKMNTFLVFQDFLLPYCPH